MRTSAYFTHTHKHTHSYTQYEKIFYAAQKKNTEIHRNAFEMNNVPLCA